MKVVRVLLALGAVVGCVDGTGLSPVDGAAGDDHLVADALPAPMDAAAPDVTSVDAMTMGALEVSPALDGPAAGPDAAVDASLDAAVIAVDASADVAPDDSSMMDGSLVVDGEVDAADGALDSSPADLPADVAADSAPVVVDSALPVDVVTCDVGAVRCRATMTEVCGADGAWHVDPANPACAAPPSCAEGGIGQSMCGPSHDDCCTSAQVPGGAFYRSYDGVSCPGGDPPQPEPAPGCYTHKTAPATVSAFRLDRYEVTAARFARFREAVTAGWRPAAGSGKHVHLNGGKGLSDLGAPGQFETGWDPTWNAGLTDWSHLRYQGGPNPSIPPSQDYPVGGTSWPQAYAFCIWDGGFLPSEAEWNFAAAGGSEQRVYPWSSPPTSTLIDCAHAAYCGGKPVGSTSPLGDGRWGQSDMAGIISEWTIDWLASYTTPAVDGARLQPPAPSDPIHLQVRVLRTSAFHAQAPVYMLTAYRGGSPPMSWLAIAGLRCARLPLADGP